MAKNPNNATKCTCDKCGHESQSIPESRHRRCGGSKGAKLKDRGDNIEVAERGVWKV